jgi:hypothetical protein
MVMALFNEAPEALLQAEKRNAFNKRQTLNFGPPGSSPRRKQQKLDEGGKHLHYETR